MQQLKVARRHRAGYRRKYSDIDKERSFLVEQYSKLSCEQEKTLERVLEILPELRELTVVWVSKDEDDNAWQVQLGLTQENGEASALATQDYLDLDTQTRAYLGFQTDTVKDTGTVLVS